jgi:hypothetical protein
MTIKAFLAKTLGGKTPWTYLYIVLVPFVNWSFGAVPSFPLPYGGEWPPVAIITGLILVVRDLAQREIGHNIFIPLAIAIGLSFMTSPANIALASAAAFAVSELVDWAIFTFTKRPLSKRIFWSTGISAPIDSTVFIYLASFTVPDIFNAVSVGASIASKLLGCVVVYYLLKHREAKDAAARLNP